MIELRAPWYCILAPLSHTPDLPSSTPIQGPLPEVQYTPLDVLSEVPARHTVQYRHPYQPSTESPTRYQELKSLTAKAVYIYHFIARRSRCFLQV